MRLQIDPQRQLEGVRKPIAPLSKVFHHTKTKKPAKRSSDQAIPGNSRGYFLFWVNFGES